MGPNKNTVYGLKSQLASVSAERNFLHGTLCQIQQGIQTDIESKLSLQATKYEIRLTELNSVITELKKQLESQHRNIAVKYSSEEQESNSEENENSSESDSAQRNSIKSNDGPKKNGKVIDRNDVTNASKSNNRPNTTMIGYEEELSCCEKPNSNEKNLEVCYIQAGDYLLSEVSTAPRSNENKTGSRGPSEPGGQLKETIKTSTAIKTQYESFQNIERNSKNKGNHKKYESRKKSQEDISTMPQSRSQSESQDKIGYRATGDPGKDKAEVCVVSGRKAAAFASLCREVTQIREEHISIRQSLKEKDGELNRTKNVLKNIAQERDFLKNKVIELEMMLSSVPTRRAQESPRSQTPGEHPPDEEDEMSFCKFAERMNLTSNHGEIPDSPNLSPTTQGNILNNNHQISEANPLSANSYNSKPQFHPQLTFITDTDLVKSVDVSCTTRLIEHLVRPFQHESRIREMETNVLNPGNGSPAMNEDKVKGHAVETERLLSRLEHLRAQNNVLALNLNAAKDHADELTVLLGKFESNNVALQLTLGYSDQAVEAYDVLVALLESELGQLLANCRAAGFGSPGSVVSHSEDAKSERFEHKDTELVQELLHRAYENCFVAESAARSILMRNADLLNSENNNCNENLMKSFHTQHTSPTSFSSYSLRSASSSRDTSSSRSPNSDTLSPRRGNLEKRVRDLIIQLKTDREAVRTTLADLVNDWNMEPEEMVPLSPCDLIEARRLDLETAVLMQELMAMREERAELRTTLFHGDQDRLGLQLKIDSLETQALTYKARINYLAGELKQREKERQVPTIDNKPDSSPDDGLTDGNANMNINLNNELILKTKIEELMNTLEKVNQATGEREQQTSEMALELKQANGMLIQTLQHHKQKYQSRIEKLEEQIIHIMHRHSTSVKLYTDKIHFLENFQQEI